MPSSLCLCHYQKPTNTNLTWITQGMFIIVKCSNNLDHTSFQKPFLTLMPPPSKSSACTKNIFQFTSLQIISMPNIMRRVFYAYKFLILKTTQVYSRGHNCLQESLMALHQFESEAFVWLTINLQSYASFQLSQTASNQELSLTHPVAIHIGRSIFCLEEIMG